MTHLDLAVLTLSSSGASPPPPIPLSRVTEGAYQSGTSCPPNGSSRVKQVRNAAVDNIAPKIGAPMLPSASMSSVSAIGQGGRSAAQAALDISVHKIASLAKGFRRERVAQKSLSSGDATVTSRRNGQRDVWPGRAAELQDPARGNGRSREHLGLGSLPGGVMEVA